MLKAIVIYGVALFLIGTLEGDPTWWIHLVFCGYVALWLANVRAANKAGTNIGTSDIDAHEDIPCDQCHGAGTIPYTSWTAHADGSQHPQSNDITCHYCAGSGRQ